MAEHFTMELGLRVGANLRRVRGLVDLYQRIVGTVAGRPSVQESDLLRAAVVLLHATLEDFLRSLASIRLPTSSVEVLKQIPFTGSDGRKTNVTLGDLNAYRGKTINEVIDKSVQSFLSRASYNNIHDLKKLLADIRLAPSLADGLAPDLAAMMARRHHIAHRFDTNESKGRGHHQARTIKKDLVSEWIDVVDRFVHTVLDAVEDGDEP